MINLDKTLKFLTLLGKNNFREWFQNNKPLYQEAREEFEIFINILIPSIKEIDPSIDVFHARECMFRIFRDVRFSKDKSPYKINFGAFIAPGGRKSPLAGYYVHVEPGASFIGGGAYMPQGPHLKAIRTEIFENVEVYKKLINKAGFTKYFKELYGEKLKTAPRDFPRDWEHIDLLRNKHYAVIHNVADTFWQNDEVMNEIAAIFKAQLKFNTFVNGAILKVIGG